MQRSSGRSFLPVSVISLFALYCFAFYSHSLDRVLSGNGGSFSQVSSSGAVQALALMNIYLAAAGHIVLGKPRQMGVEAIATVSLVGLCALSAAWSSDPSLTLRRSVSVVGVFLTCSYLYRALGAQALWELFVKFAAGFVLVQAVLLAGVPGYAFHQASDAGVAEHAGRFRGFYFHKNEAARFGLTMLLVILVSKRHFKLWKWLFFLACAVLTLLETQSAKVIAAFLASALVYGFLRLPAGALVKVVCILYFAAMAWLFAAAIGQEEISAIFAEALGRDASFSGRDVLWQLALDQIAEKPLLGGGFYSGWPQSAKDYLTMLKGENGAVGHAHNGYLQLLLDIGTAGLVLVLVPSFLFLKRIMGRPVQGWSEIEHFGALFVPGYFILNLAGSYLLVTNDIFQWLILFLALESGRRTAALAQQASVLQGLPLPLRRQVSQSG